MSDQLLYSPMPIVVQGKDKEYHFLTYNIDDEVDPDVSGVYIFTVRKWDNRAAPIESHILLSFASIKYNNAEAIKSAKDNGAMFMLYRSSSSEPERLEIISDIKAGQDYQYQLETFPDLVGILP